MCNLGKLMQIQTTRAGNMMNRYTNSSTDPDVKAAASDVLNSWKKAIRELKEKRKRDEEEKGAAGGAGTPGEGEERDAKRVKAESAYITREDGDTAAETSGGCTEGREDTVEGMGHILPCQLEPER